MKPTAFASKLLFACVFIANSLYAANYYWVHPGTATANWSDAANWRTTSGGAIAHATPPTAADNVFFDANSFSVPGRIVVVNVAAFCANMTWTGATNAPTFTINSPLTIRGNLTFIAGMTVNGTAVVTFTGNSPQTITMAGRTFGGDVMWTKDAGSAATLADAFATNGDFILQQDGDFNSANQNITCRRFEVANVGTANMGTSTINITSALNIPPSLDLSGAGTINLATATLNFTNTTAGTTTRMLLGDIARNNGNITIAGATALKNVILEGSEDHQIGVLNIGSNINFSQSTAGYNYTYGSITAAASTVPGAGLNFESTTTVTGATNIGNGHNVTFKGGNTNLNGAVSFGSGNTVAFNNSGTVVFGNTLTAAAATAASSLTFANTVSNVTHTGAVTYGGNNGLTVNYNNTGTVTFSNTTTVANATGTAFNTVNFANTVTNVLHNHDITLNNRVVMNYNNVGFVQVGTAPANRNFTAAGSTVSVTLAPSVAAFSVTGNTNLGSNNTFTLNNSGSINFGDAAGDTFVSGNGTTLNVGGGSAGKNFTVSGSAVFGTANNVSINNIGNTSINGNLTYNGGGSNFQYGNGGTVTFGGTVTAAGITGTLAVQFTNGSNTTYNGAVSLTTAPGVANSINYQFAGGQTANINANFTVSGACDNIVTIGRTGTGSATLNLTATPPHRNWVRVNVSNINASSLANNIRAYAYTDGGGNSGIDFRNNSTTANRTLYWVAGGPQAGTNTLWSNLNNWSFEPDEFIPAVCLPTVADSVVFGHHDISFSPTNPTVDVNGNYAVAGMRWSATDVTPANPVLRSVGGTTRTLTIAGAFDNYRTVGTLTFQNESPANRLNFVFTGAARTPANGWNEIRSSGINFPREVVFNGNTDNTRWRLVDNFSARIDAGANPSNNGSLYLQRGVFDTNGQNLILGRFNAHRFGTSGAPYTAVTFTTPRTLIISGPSHWTIQGRTGNLTAGSVPDVEVMDLGGANFTFNTPDPQSYWYFSGANVDSTANTEGAWAFYALGRGSNVPREVPNMGFGRRLADIDVGVDAAPTPFHFREIRLSNVNPPGSRQIYIQTFNDANTQLIFKGIVDFGHNTNFNANSNVGTVIRGPNVAPADAAWSNISRFEKQVIIGNNSHIPFWGNFRFDGPITLGELSRVWFSSNGGTALSAAAGNRYMFNDDLTIGKASIAYFYANVTWPVAGKTMTIGEEALAYVGIVPSTVVFPIEYGNNIWQNIVLQNQARLILNNGKGGGGVVENNIIANLTMGEFSTVELNTAINPNPPASTPRTRITQSFTTSFTGVCSSWASLFSIVDGQKADLILNSAQTVNALTVKDVNVVENVPGIDLTVNAGADAGNNAGATSLTFSGARLGRNFYWVGGTNKDKTKNTFRKIADTNYDGIPDDNGDNVLWTNPANWYTEPATNPVLGSLTEAQIMQDNQCVPTIIDNVYFLDDSFRGSIQNANFFRHRRRVIVDIPQAQARDFIWNLTSAAAMNAPGKVTTPGDFVTGTAATGPAIFTNEQQPILPTTEIQIAGNLRWAPPGGPLSTDAVANPNLTTMETILRNDFISRFSFIGSGMPHTGPGTGPTVHTIESNGQRFAGEVMFDNRYSTWTPIDPMDLNSHRQATSYPVPPLTTAGGNTPWSRASIIINQGALDMGSPAYKVGQPRRINLEGDWTISGLLDYAQFDAATSEVVFDGSVNANANANDVEIRMHENIRVPAPTQPVVQPANDPNGAYDPARRRFYDLTINKRANTWDVRILNSPVTVMRNINIQQGRLWDNDENTSVPMQIKGNLLGTGTFTMANGTSLFLGSNSGNVSNSGVNANRFSGTVPHNLGTDFPDALNFYPTTFPMGYTRSQISLHANSTVIYWARGQQNVSAVPVYGNLRLESSNRGHLEFNDASLNLVRKRHVINETVTGGVTYNTSTLNHSLSLPTVMTGGTLDIQGDLDLCFNGYPDAIMIGNGLRGVRTNGGVELLDHGNQIVFTGAPNSKTLFIGPGSYLTLGAARDQNLRDAYSRTFSLTNVATTFPDGYAVELHEQSFVNYNSGADQIVKGLNGTGNQSYGNLMIVNRDRGLPSDVPALALARKTLDAPVNIRRQLRIYPNAHLVDNGHQITFTGDANSRFYMTSRLPATGGLATGGRTANANDLHDLRNTWPDMPNLLTTAIPFRGESRLTLGNATTATSFPTGIANNNVLLQTGTTIVYQAGVPQNIRAFTNAADTTQIYANLVLVNPAVTSTPVNKTAVQEAGSGAAAPAANAAGDATVDFLLKGDLIIAPNNSFVDNGYQVRNPHAVNNDGMFRMAVLKTTADALTPRLGRTTLAGGNNASGANGVSRIMLGTADIASQFPINFSGTDDAEIDFEIAPHVSPHLYSNVVYNSGRRQIIRNLNKSTAGMNRVYGHITLTNPSATPNGPVPKLMENGDFHMRGSLTINPNNNLRTTNLANNDWRTVVPVVHTVSSTPSVPQLQMFSTVAAASAALGGHNPQGAAVNGPSFFTILHTTALTFPALPQYNATHLNLQEGTTIVYANAGNQSIQALADAAPQAQYANLWLMHRGTTNNPNYVNKTVVAGSSTFTSVRVRGHLVIGCNNNLIDNGLQIIGTSGQAFRMYQVRTDENAFIHAGMPGTYAPEAIVESVGRGAVSTLYGGSGPNTAFGNGVSVLTLGTATVATQFPTNYADADILMQNNTTVCYNAGPVAGGQTIRALFNAPLNADNNYAHLEIVNPNTADDNPAIKKLAGNIRIRGNLYISGGITAANRNTATTADNTGRNNNLQTQNYNINIQGHWFAFTNGNGAQVNLTTFAVSGTPPPVNRSGLFTAGTGTVTFEGNNRAQRLMSGSLVSGTGSGFTTTVDNRFHNVVIDKGTAGSVHGRTVYIMADPMLVQQTVTFTNGYFWSNADGSGNNGTVNNLADDNQMTFLDNASAIQVQGSGSFPGAPGTHNNSYVVGAVRKIGRASTPASAVGGANTFDFPIGLTPYTAGNLPDTWMGRNYYIAPAGVLDLTANHDFVARYYGTNANTANTDIPAGIRPQDMTPAISGNYPTNVKEASLRYINETEFWTIDATAKTGASVASGLTPFRVKVSWDSNPDRTAINVTLPTVPLQVAHWTNKGSGLMWYDENRSAMLGTGAAGVQVSNPTTFNGPFNNGDDNISILPIELISFRARAVSGDREKVEITWQTAWERDNDFFEVEKSRDGINFQTIARVPSKGNNGASNTVQSYVHYDEQPWTGRNYYRLKQVDFDGTISFSKIEVVVFERNALAPTAGNMEVYPNPFESSSQTLNVVLPEGGVGEGWLVIWDMAGREMHREPIAAGQTKLTVTPEQTQGKLANGAYIIRAVGRDKAFTAKVVVE